MSSVCPSVCPSVMVVCITDTRRRDHITPVLRQLHWLPVRQRVDFKLALLVYKALHDSTAPYLVDDRQLVSHADRRRLRSSDIDTCCVPRTNTRFGDRSFASAGPKLWTVELSAGYYPSVRQRHRGFPSAAQDVFTARCTIVHSAVL